ncbi:hypothetical protein KW796_00095 [Candidatus Parcubacteria bacterium]|nr:hypothetical protein [Candidatus Parcubacteria bacterium]
MERDSIKEFFQKKAEEERSNSLMPVLEHRKEEIKRSEVEKDRSQNLKQASVIWLGAIAACTLIVYGGSMIFDRYKMITDNSPASIVAQVGRVVDLPKDEMPTIATITTMENLRDQPFFKDAMVGDKVIVFNNSRKAILYRPGTKKVIGVATLSE